MGSHSNQICLFRKDSSNSDESGRHQSGSAVKAPSDKMY